MDIKINNRVFNKALSEVSRAVTSNHALPILAGIKITADQQGITLVGGCLDIHVEKYIPTIIDGEEVLDIIQTGSVVVTAKYLTEAAKKLPHDIHINVNETLQVTMKSGDIAIRLNGLDSEEYPMLPQIDRANGIHVPSSELADSIRQTVFAAAKNETRPILTAVNMTFRQNKLICTATNSQRLAYKELPISSNANGSFNVPSKSLQELIRLMDKDSGTMTIFATDQYIVFMLGSISLYSRLIGGDYPSIAGLIPQESKSTMILDTQQFLQGIDRACLFADESCVHLEVLDGTALRIGSTSSKAGIIEERQSIESLNGEKDLQLALNGHFLIDAFKAIKESQVKVSFNGPMRPILIEPVNNPAHLQIISPVLSNKQMR